MAPAVRDDIAASSVTATVDCVPRVCFELELGVHLVEAQPGDEVEFSWLDGIHGAVFTMGLDGVQLNPAWDHTEG